VCHKHGAGAPQVKAAAKRRLLEAAAEAELSRILARDDLPGIVDFADELARVAAALKSASSAAASGSTG
jgi:hypothetical protein